MFEDYQTPLYDFHEDVVGYWTMFTVFTAVPLLLLSWVVGRLRSSQPRTRYYQGATYVGGCALIILAGNFDPTTFTAWFLD
jgi:hypothetical protein